MRYILSVAVGLAILSLFYFFSIDNALDDSTSSAYVQTTEEEPVFPSQAVQSLTTDELSSPPVKNNNDGVDLKKVILPALSVDQLLNEADKTERNKVIINSHDKLLSVSNEYKALRKANLQTPSYDQLLRWTQTVIQSMYIRNELGQGNIPSTDWDDLQVLTPDLIPDSPSSLAYISSKDLEKVIALTETVSSMDEHTLTEQNAWSVGAKIHRLVYDSKDYSEGYYLEQMRAYLSSDEYTVPEKIEFTRHFLQAKDWNLVKFAAQFFQRIPLLSNNETHQVEIEALLNDIEQGLKLQ